MKNIIAIIFDALFPFRCVCGKWGETICSDCFLTISINKTQLCPICKKISENGKTCSSCRGKSFLTGVMIFGEHEGVLKDLIWQYKYEFIRNLSEPLAQLLEERFGPFVKKKKFLITAVPSSKKRLRWRGFNQSALLGQSLADKTNLSFENLLIRLGQNKSQVGLSKKLRASNIEGKIDQNKNISVIAKSRRILIVDDVYTTGATLEECAKILRQMGATEVWGMVLSRD